MVGSLPNKDALLALKITSPNTVKQLIVTITFFRYLGYHFSSTACQKWPSAWMKSYGLSIQANVCFIAARKINLSNHLLEKKAAFFCYFCSSTHGLSFSSGLLSTNKRFHHADERNFQNFFRFSTSPSLNAHSEFKKHDCFRHTSLASLKNTAWNSSNRNSNDFILRG